MASTTAPQPTTMNLLSFDGGGIRGLSSLYLLADLMQKIKFSANLDTEPLPANYFDMIGGTSTGGIIAIMLGRLRMSASECIRAYSTLSERVFGERNQNSFMKKTKFSEEELEKAIEETVEMKLGKGQGAEKFLDPNTSGCKTLVCTYERRGLGGAPILLRSYESPEQPIDCTIVQAARATSAAETFFPHATIGTQSYTDAGMGMNNPTEEILREAMNYYRQRGYAVKKPTCIVSIGTGEMSLINLQEAESTTWWRQLPAAERSGFNAAGILSEIVSDCSQTHMKVLNTFHQMDIAHLYFRFNVDKGLEKISLDEYKRSGDIESATTKYLQRLSVERKPEECAKILRFSRTDSWRLELQMQAAHYRDQARQLAQQANELDSAIEAPQIEQGTQESPRRQVTNEPEHQERSRVQFGRTQADRDVNQIYEVHGNARMGGGDTTRASKRSSGAGEEFKW